MMTVNMKEKNDLRPHLSPLEAQAVALKATGLSNRQIAPIVGVSSRTIDRMVSKPDLKRLIEQTTEQFIADTLEAVLDNQRQAILAAQKVWSKLNSTPFPKP